MKTCFRQCQHHSAARPGISEDRQRAAPSGAPRSGAPLARLERATRARLRAGVVRAFDFDVAAGIEAHRAETACGLGAKPESPTRLRGRPTWLSLSNQSIRDAAQGR